jgi:ParB family transcriptional regulator, chromosome partitioning protein
MPDVCTGTDDVPGREAAAPPGGGRPPRRLEHLPLTGPGAVFTQPQGRSGQSFAPENLADLISSIAAGGLLQPVLVEEIPQPGGGAAYRLVAGERRLRAMLWGAAHLPASPHFASLPAVVLPGPLSEADRRRAQLAENLAREDLQPGELAAALLFERCAILAERLEAAGRPVPEAVTAVEDPAERYRLLERLRGGRADLGAPWRDVLDRLGVTMSPRRARALTAAFRVLPRELSADLDRHQIALGTRLKVARLAGRPEAAEEIWAAVKQRGRPDLVAAAASARASEPGLAAPAAAGRAMVTAAAAADARAVRRSACPAGQMIDPVVVESLLAGLRSLSALLHAGSYVDRFSAGSLRLLALEVAGQVAVLESGEGPG